MDEERRLYIPLLFCIDWISFERNQIFITHCNSHFMAKFSENVASQPFTPSLNRVIFHLFVDLIIALIAFE